jgi:hypothetical protein
VDHSALGMLLPRPVTNIEKYDDTAIHEQNTETQNKSLENARVLRDSSYNTLV